MGIQNGVFKMNEFILMILLVLFFICGVLTGWAITAEYYENKLKENENNKR